MVLFTIAAKSWIKTIIQCLLKHTTKCPIKSTNTMISQLTVSLIVEKKLCSCDPFLYAQLCCELRKNSPWHSWTAVNNVVDDVLLLIAPTAVEATLRLRPKFHRFNLSLYLLQSWLYNKSIKWSLSIVVQICDNNWHFSVCVAVCYQPPLVVW